MITSTQVNTTSAFAGQPPLDLHLPIVLRCGKRHSTSHPISKFISYDHLSPVFCQFDLSISTETVSKNYSEALQISHWKSAMDDEIHALQTRDTWELINRPPDSAVVSCRWVFVIKHKPDGSIDRYKAYLVASEFTQTYDVNYAETFSLVARLNSIHVLLSFSLNQD